MSRTVTIHGSEDVLAMFGIPGHFYRGRWQNIKVIKESSDEETSIEIRKGLVGLIVPTIFTKESIEKQTGASLPIPANSRLAYVPDVVNVLRSAGKNEEAERLAKDFPKPLDMYIFEPETYVTA